MSPLEPPFRPKTSEEILTSTSTGFGFCGLDGDGAGQPTTSRISFPFKPASLSMRIPYSHRSSSFNSSFSAISNSLVALRAAMTLFWINFFISSNLNTGAGAGVGSVHGVREREITFSSLSGLEPCRGCTVGVLPAVGSDPVTNATDSNGVRM